jgi:hypothetical protein
MNLNGFWRNCAEVMELSVCLSKSHGAQDGKKEERQPNEQLLLQSLPFFEDSPE